MAAIGEGLVGTGGIVGAGSIGREERGRANEAVCACVCGAASDGVVVIAAVIGTVAEGCDAFACGIAVVALGWGGSGPQVAVTGDVVKGCMLWRFLAMMV